MKINISLQFSDLDKVNCLHMWFSLVAYISSLLLSMLSMKIAMKNSHFFPQRSNPTLHHPLKAAAFRNSLRNCDPRPASHSFIPKPTQSVQLVLL